jgi:hypothetical protein
VGGIGSGRRSGRATVESCLTLDLCAMIRRGHLVPGRRLGGIMAWSRDWAPRPVAQGQYEADLCDPDAAWMRLAYSVPGAADGAGVRQDYRVRLVTTPCPFGGLRWWFLCPLSGRRVVRLHLPPGGTLFASRRAHGLAYRSLREGWLDRSHARQRRAFARLGAEYTIFGQSAPRRPRWMRERTFARLVTELGKVVAAHEYGLR